MSLMARPGGGALVCAPSPPSAQTGADAGVSAFPDGDDIFHWVGTIEGGAGTVRAGDRSKATQSSALTPRPRPPAAL